MNADVVRTEVATLDTAEIRRQLVETCQRLKISQADAARRAGLKSSTLNLWVNDRYTGDNARLTAEVDRWLRSLSERAELRQSLIAKPDFLRTPTANRIWSMLEQAQFAPDIVVAAGVPGIGKTMTAGAYRAANPNVWIATMDPGTRSAHAVLSEIATVMGVVESNAMRLRHTLGERMQGTQGLLIIDEAQHLTRQALDMLRSFHDRYQIGLALMGNAGLYGGAACGTAEDNFAQFYSRIGDRRKFTAPQPDDIQMILDAYDIDHPEERRFLAQVAAKMGALRSLQKCVTKAAVLAAGAESPVELEHYRAAFAALNHVAARP